MAKPTPQLLLGILRHRMQYDFPVGAYYESIWAAWEERIKQGQKQEQANLKKMYESWGGHPDADDWAADDNYMIGEATRSMYAALCVAIWAQCETTLGALSRFVGKKPSHKIIDVKKSFKSSARIDMEHCAGYSIFNGLRILNNSFKHSDGKYRASGRPVHDQLDPAFEMSAQVRLDSSDRIEYENLDLSAVVDGCGRFFGDLIAQLDSHVKTSQAGGPP